MKKRQKRILAVIAIVAGVAVSAMLASQAFRSNLMYFQTPTDLVAIEGSEIRQVRLGGLVEAGSVKRLDGLKVAFSIADCEHNVPVKYEGILPDLFREGQGVVTTGLWNGTEFEAKQVLAKHDENYMPPELAEALTGENGHSCAEFKTVGEEKAQSGYTS